MNPRATRPLERAGVRHELVRLLAAGETTHTKLGERFGVSQSAVSQFAKRHAVRIAEVRADLASEFAGLWAASKADRIDALQADIELCEHMLYGTSPGEPGYTPPDPAWARVKAAALRSVAEELGQIPHRAGPAAPGDVSFTLTIPRPNTDES